MKFSAMVVCVAIGLSIAAQSTWSQEFDSETRRWQSQNGEHSIEAKLVGYDYDTQIVELERDDGGVIETHVKKLSTRDRQYVLKQLRKLRPQTLPERKPKQKPELQDENTGPSEFDSLANEDKNRSVRSSRAGKNLYGIRWQTSIPSALDLARGRETMADDRPVFWFRVLGDLDGFM